MDRTGLNAAPVQKALKGIKKYKYILLTALLGVLGVFSVLALCLAPLLHLAVQYLFYQLAAFFSAVTGADPLCKFLEQLSSAFSLMLAMTAGGAFLLLVSFLIAMMMVVTV